MAGFGAVVLGAVVLWFGSYVICGSWVAIVTDSGSMRHYEAFSVLSLFFGFRILVYLQIRELGSSKTKHANCFNYKNNINH